MLYKIRFKKEVKMPAGDRTGPMGEGPVTGRGLGYCRDNDFAGNRNLLWNPGRGFGPGRGRGFRGGRGLGFKGAYGSFYQGSADVSEKTLIENEIRILKDQLSALEDRLSKSK
jgi:hypothetical protein